MQMAAAYIAEVMKLKAYVKSKEDSLIQIFRTHQLNTNSTRLQTVKNFKKSFQSERKHIKT
jgi:hypothetical protein